MKKFQPEEPTSSLKKLKKKFCLGRKKSQTPISVVLPRRPAAAANTDFCAREITKMRLDRAPFSEYTRGLIQEGKSEMAMTSSKEALTRPINPSELFKRADGKIESALKEAAFSIRETIGGLSTMLQGRDSLPPAIPIETSRDDLQRTESRVIYIIWGNTLLLEQKVYGEEVYPEKDNSSNSCPSPQTTYRNLSDPAAWVKYGPLIRERLKEIKSELNNSKTRKNQVAPKESNGI